MAPIDGPDSASAAARCPACGAENASGGNFCAVCGASLRPGDDAAAGERKVVTVVFADLVGSTVLGHRLDPEALRALMSRYFEAMRGVVARHGGTVDKFIGDAVMAVFGVPRLHEDDALRAVRAAADMLEALAALNVEIERVWDVALHIRIGVNTGEVLVGERTAGQGLIVGDAVNVAARLEQSAGPGEVLLGDGTHRLVHAAVTADAVGPLELRGKPNPVATWRLVEVLPQASGWRRPTESELVDRHDELAALEAAFSRVVAERCCALVSVVGPAGAGKSRLARELVRRVGDVATVVEGRCLPYGEGITFWPVAAALRSAAGIGERDSAADARAKIAALLGASDDDADLVGDRLAALLGLGSAAPGIQETFWAVRKLLERLAAGRPLVVVFEDIHWGEETFLDLVEYLADRIADAPVLLLCLSRGEIAETRPGWTTGGANRTLLVPRPLTVPETEGLIHSLVGGATLAARARQRIAEFAEGNPLYVEETVRMLADDGVLDRAELAAGAGGELSSISIPSTIHALMTARLDRLSPDERAVIERASVVGRSFWWGALAELSPPAIRPDLSRHLQALIRKELIRPDSSEIRGDDGFRFAHILIRDAAYNAIPKSARAEMHERLAAWIAGRFAGRSAEYDEIVGYHLEQAYRSRLDLAPATPAIEALGRRAAAPLASAGRRAFVRGDMPAAVNLLSRAVEMLGDRSPDQPDLLPQLAFALMETGDFERLRSVAADTAAAAAATGDAGLEAHATILGLWIRLFTNPAGWAAEAQREATGAMFAFQEVGDERGLARAWSLLGLLHIMNAQFARAQDAWSNAALHARNAGDRRDELESLSWVPLTLWAGPTPADEGIRGCREVLDRARGDTKATSSALFCQAAFEAGLGRFDEARALFARAGGMLDDLGLAVWRAGPFAQFRGWAELLAGDPAAAERELAAAADTLRQIGEVSWLSSVLGILAEAVDLQGRHDDAEHLVQASLEAAAEDDVYARVLAQCVRAKVLARRGQADEAVRLARAAVGLARAIDFLHLRWHALLCEADVLALAGRAAEALPAIEEAIGVAEAKGNVVGARLARHRIEHPAAEGSPASRRL